MNLNDKNNRPIRDWRNWSRPKEPYQWKSGRSAMELARAWFTSRVPITPPEIAGLLDSRDETRGALLEEGWPELKTELPERGEGRNHDLVLIGSAGTRRLLVAVEGKVDETMGPPIGQYWRKSKRTSGSKAWKRIDTLLEAAFGTSASAEREQWSSLPYQMLTALAGTAIEASKRKCDIAVLIVHEFKTESAKTDLLRKNAAEYAAFLRALGVQKPAAAQLYGPFPIKADGHDVPVLVGKVQYKWA